MIPSPAIGPRSLSVPVSLLHDVASVALGVDPPSWWLTSGNRTQLTATWTGIPPGCVANPLWFRWTLLSGSAEGTLGSIDNPSVNFIAGSAESGRAEVEARSTVLVICGASQEAAYDTAVSTITVVTPLRIENVSLAPDPVATGAVSNLSGLLVGGQPPYQVRIDWNDGHVSLNNLSAPGTFRFAHRFANGTFYPSILASDAVGLVANGSVDGPLSASSGLAVAVTTPTVEAEVGVPVQFSGEVLDPPAQYGSVTQCSDALPDRPTDSPANTSIANFTCRFASPGTAEVAFEVVPIDDDLPEEEARWWEPVAPSLTLNVSPPVMIGEVGLPTVFTVQLSGGVPPFFLTWRLVGNSTVEQELAYADGSILVPVWPSEYGTYALIATVRDALGVLVSAGSVALPVDPPLNVSATANWFLSSSGAVVQVAGTVSQGTAPFLWWVLPGVVPMAPSAPNGSLPSVGSFSWNGTLAREGNSTVSVVVVDGDGAVGWETIPVPLVPELRANAQAVATLNATGSALLLNLSIGGGLPPFDLEISSSAGEVWNRSVAADGPYTFTFPTNDSGSVNFELTLRDFLGVEWMDAVAVAFRPLPPPSNGSSSPPNATSPPPSPTRPTTNATSGVLPWNSASSLFDLTVIAGACVAAFVLVWRRWHRPARDPAPAADPERVLRRILEPADGAERSTVELMAEEAGIPMDVVRSTIDRLVIDGSIRSESGGDGEEVLAWSDPDRS